MSKLRIAGMAAALFVGVTAAFIAPYEGENLTAEKDMVGVWTLCWGETHDVQPGDTATHEECVTMLQQRVQQFALRVDSLVTAEVKPEVLMAYTSLSYNVGLEAFKNSTALRLTNQGDTRGGCEAIMLWEKLKATRGSREDLADGKADGRRDCSLPAAKCGGIHKRRIAERAMCLKGISP